MRTSLEAFMRNRFIALAMGVLIAVGLVTGVSERVSATSLGTARQWLATSLRPVTRMPVIGLLARSLMLEANPGQAASGAQVATDKPGYLVGESAAISGSGFVSGEVVTLQVTHANGDAEANPGHVPFFAVAEADGSFSAS